MREDIKPFLAKVQKPGRYVGGEAGSVYKDKSSIGLRVAFCFPDIYDIGMSNLGMRILCGVLNEMEDVWCERAFAPWPDMEAEMRARDIPVYTHESGDSIREFGIVAFTLQYELCYTTALNMLDMSKIPLRSRDRDDSFPIVLAGGPCAYNPEPMADFVDIFSIGEGEEALPELAQLYLDMKQAGTYSKEAFLRAASHLEGFYVPSLYDVSYREDGTILEMRPKYPDVPRQVKKRIVADVDRAYFPTDLVMPLVETVHDRITLEVNRGCIRGCRFCQAGFVTRPVREKSPETLCAQAREMAKNTGYDEISMCSLSISDYSRVNSLCDSLLTWTDDAKINLSLPSLRADSFTRELMEQISTVRSSTLTFAPEAGSQRLRDVINKNVTEEDILRAAGVAFSSGKSQVKLYFMNGLPYETLEDIEGIATLAKNVVESYYKTPGRAKGRQPKVTISVACFIPKPFTPFQWEGQNTAAQLEEKQQHLLSCLHDRKIRYNYHDAKVSWLEAVFARGNRRLSAALEEAVRRGMRLEAWEEFFDYDGWQQIFADTGINPAFYANRTMGEEEILPWDVIDCGVSKKFLLRERHKAMEAAVTPSCKEQCSGCGANTLAKPSQCRWCPGHLDTPEEHLKNLSRSTVPLRADAGKRDARGAGAVANPGERPVRTIRICYSKGGAFTYVSHLDIHRTFTRALVKSGLPVYYTEGFNPIPKLTFASPLSVGASGEAEFAQFKLVRELENGEILNALCRAMPSDIKIREVYTPQIHFKEIAWAENQIDFYVPAVEGVLSALASRFDGPIVVLKRTKSSEKETDIRPLIRNIQFERFPEGVRIIAVTRADSVNYLNPVYVAKACMPMIDPNVEGYYTIHRRQLLLEDGSSFR